MKWSFGRCLVGAEREGAHAPQPGGRDVHTALDSGSAFRRAPEPETVTSALTWIRVTNAFTFSCQPSSSGPLSPLLGDLDEALALKNLVDDRSNPLPLGQLFFGRHAPGLLVGLRRRLGGQDGVAGACG